MRRVRGAWWSICLYILATGQALALGNDDTGEILRAPSMQGLTGLLTMNTAEVRGPGIALSVYGLAESSSTPAYSIVQVPVVLLVGFSENIEIAARSKLVTATGGGRAGRDTGLGDSELLAKWKFRNQNENLPAMALGLGVLFPTGDAAKGFAEADNWGGKFMVMASSETAIFEDSFLGLYGEAQYVVRDRFFGAATVYTDTYGLANAGLTFPISDDNRLLFTTEYNRFIGKGSLFLGDSAATITPSLRYVARYINLAAGVQFLTDSTQSSGYRQRFIASLGVSY